MGHLKDIHGPSRGNNSSTKSKRKTASHELADASIADCATLDNSPTRIKVAPMAMPILRPKVSIAGPMDGMATTLPIWYMEVTMPVQMPTSAILKKSLNCGISNSELNMEPSNPLAVDQKNPIRHEKYRTKAAPLKSAAP